MKRRVIASMLAAMMAVALTACGGQAAAPAPAEPAPAPAAEVEYICTGGRKNVKTPGTKLFCLRPGDQHMLINCKNISEKRSFPGDILKRLTFKTTSDKGIVVAQNA